MASFNSTDAFSQNAPKVLNYFFKQEKLLSEEDKAAARNKAEKELVLGQLSEFEKAATGEEGIFIAVLTFIGTLGMGTAFSFGHRSLLRYENRGDIFKNILIDETKNKPETQGLRKAITHMEGEDLRLLSDMVDSVCTQIISQADQIFGASRHHEVTLWTNDNETQSIYVKDYQLYFKDKEKRTLLLKEQTPEETNGLALAKDDTIFTEEEQSQRNFIRLAVSLFKSTNSDGFVGADLSDLNLCIMDFSGLSMKYAVLSGSNLTGAKFVGCTLCSAEFNNKVGNQPATLTKANFSQAVLNKADMRKIKAQGANFSHAIFREADLSEGIFKQAIFNYADMTRAIMPKAQFSEAVMANVAMYRCNAKKAVFEKADLRKGNLKGADLEEANMQGADLFEVDLGSTWECPAKTNLNGTDLKKAKMQRVTTGDAIMKGTNLERANLSGADLSYSIMSGLNMQGVTMVKTSLTETNLSGSNLTGAKLSNFMASSTNLEKSDLTNAEITNVNFREGNFTEAILNQLILVGTNLRSATGITDKMKKSVKLSDSRTVWPEEPLDLFKMFTSLVAADE